MFATRLNPTSPPARHRATLERVGLSCRRLRPLEQSCSGAGKANRAIPSAFAATGSLAIGRSEPSGGAGADSLLAVMAAERVGREGLHPAAFFVSHCAGNYISEQFALPGISSESFSDGSSVWSHAICHRDETGSSLTPSAAMIRATGNGWNSLFAGRMVVYLTGTPAEDPRCVVVNWPGSTDLPDDRRPVREVVLCCAENELVTLTGGARVWDYGQLTCRLLWSGSLVGLLAQTLEEVCAFCRRVELRPEREITALAVELEAARGLVYAAAQLKSDLDKRLENRHLWSETSTLIHLAYFRACQAAHEATEIVSDLLPQEQPTPICQFDRSLRREFIFLFGDPHHCGIVDSIAGYYLT